MSQGYVLLVSWANGTREAVPIVPGGVLSLGPGRQRASTPIELCAPNSHQPIGWVVVHGPEHPRLLVAPAVAGNVGVPTRPESPERLPEWLSELMAEVGRRHDLLSVEGLDGAADDAVRMAADLALRSKSCARLACGYRSAASAVVCIDGQDPAGWTRHSEAARDFFRESVSLAREAEEVGA
jgi:hypothetical protein